MHASRLKHFHVSSITEIKRVVCWNSSDCIFNQVNESFVFRDAREIGLGIAERAQLAWYELCEIKQLTGEFLSPI